MKINQQLAQIPQIRIHSIRCCLVSLLFSDQMFCISHSPYAVGGSDKLLADFWNGLNGFCTLIRSQMEPRGADDLVGIRTIRSRGALWAR
jgi:hypothetical protein